MGTDIKRRPPESSDSHDLDEIRNRANLPIPPEILFGPSTEMIELEGDASNNPPRKKVESDVDISLEQVVDKDLSLSGDNSFLHMVSERRRLVPTVFTRRNISSRVYRSFKYPSYEEMSAFVQHLQCYRSSFVHASFSQGGGMAIDKLLLCVCSLSQQRLSVMSEEERKYSWSELMHILDWLSSDTSLSTEFEMLLADCLDMLKSYY